MQLRPARGQLPVRRRAEDGRRPRRLQERRQGDRLAARRGAVVHREVQRARGQLVPHPLLVLGRRREPVPRSAAGTAARRCSSRSSPGSSQYTTELAYFFAPNVNSYKRYAHGSFAPTAMVWGEDNRTCAFRVVGHGKGMRLESRLPGGDCNPVPGLRRDHRDGHRGHRPRPRARAGVRRQRVRLRRPPRPRQPARGDPPAGGLRVRAPRVRRHRRRPLPQRRPARAAGVREPPSPTGSCTAPSSGCRPVRPRIGISAYWRAASWGPWTDMPACMVPQGYVEGVQRGRRPRAADPARPRSTPTTTRPACSRSSTG